MDRKVEEEMGAKREGGGGGGGGSSESRERWRGEVGSSRRGGKRGVRER